MTNNCNSIGLIAFMICSALFSWRLLLILSSAPKFSKQTTTLTIKLSSTKAMNRLSMSASCMSSLSRISWICSSLILASFCFGYGLDFAVWIWLDFSVLAFFSIFWAKFYSLKFDCFICDVFAIYCTLKLYRFCDCVGVCLGFWQTICYANC